MLASLPNILEAQELSDLEKLLQVELLLACDNVKHLVIVVFIVLLKGPSV